MNQEVNAHPTLSEQEQTLNEVHSDHVRRMQESGVLQKAQRAYVAQYLNAGEELEPDKFAVGHQQQDKTEVITVTNDGFRHVVVGTIDSNDKGELVLTPDQKGGFNVVEARSVLAMVRELQNLKTSGKLPDLTDDLQRIEKSPPVPAPVSSASSDSETSRAASELAKLNAKFDTVPPSAAPTAPEPAKTAATAKPTEIINTDEKIDLDTAVKMLSYADVMPEEHQKDAIEAIQKGEESLLYARELQNLLEREGRAEILGLARSMVEDCLNVLVSRNIPASLYAPSVSWALWDVAKQSYLANHPEKSSPEYADNVESPLSLTSKGDRKRAEIRQRHIGWEVMHAWDRGDLKPEELSEQAQRILSKGERTGKGELRSFELAQLGRIIINTSVPNPGAVQA